MTMCVLVMMWPGEMLRSKQLTEPLRTNDQKLPTGQVPGHETTWHETADADAREDQNRCKTHPHVATLSPC